MITDVLIIGSGISGGTAALTLANAGIKVVIITRSNKPLDSNTYYAQGGIIYKGNNDSIELLEKDIINAGSMHNNLKHLKILATEGPDLVKSILIDDLDIPFDKNNDGSLSLIKEGAHSSRRILHSSDTTGKSIETALIEKISNHKNIKLFTDFTAIDIITTSHHTIDIQDKHKEDRCLGAYVLDRITHEVHRIIGKDTIIATGGLGRIYLQSSNPDSSRGDGLAMAYRLGARVINCEYVQFHPTTFYDEFAPNFLISEAVRGAGAKLVNYDGEYFMSKYSPKWKDLASRDEVARSIHQEMLDSGKPNVFLDIKSFIPKEEIRKKFPEILNQLKKYNIDISKELVPVVPAAHYFCGGVWVNEHGESSIKNLYAIGEISCTGVHGANRIGSAALLEGLTWGYRAGIDIEKKIGSQKAYSLRKIPRWKFVKQSDFPDAALINQDMSAIQHLMWNYVGLVRTTKRLNRAYSELRNLEYEIEKFYRSTRLTDELIGLRNSVRSALIITTAALSNKVSSGCHYRL